MFKLFAKQKTTTPKFDKSIFYGKTPDEIVDMIHADFDSAEDRLLQSAQQMLNELNIETQGQLIERADLAKKVGFVNVPSVKRAVELQDQERISTEQANLICHFKRRYPFQKFLTEDELNRICAKYGLIHAPVANYVKDVPEKNLREIADAPKLQDEDEHGAIRRYKEEVELNRKYNIPMLDYVGINLWGGSRAAAQKREGLFIAAPASHFDLSNLEQDGKFGYSLKIEVPDPVVFRYVKGGIQVLSKWGKEASDELLQNPIEN